MKKFIISICCVLCICIATICCGTMQKFVYAESEFSASARSAILIDNNTGEVLFGQNQNEKLQVASIVKLMTILLTIEEIENGNLCLEDTLVASEYACSMGGSQVFLDVNQEYKIGKMLQSVIMASANDASVALAEKICGSENAFVKKMNSKAKELNMLDTIYENSTGLPSPMQHSTAKDTANLLSVVITKEIYHSFSSLWMDELVHSTGRKTEIVNTNKLVRYYEGCDSGKTGFTDEAGYCLASSVNRDNMRLIAVVLGTKNAKERFNESVKLYNWGFANFTNEQIVNSELPIQKISVKRGAVNEVELFASEDFYGLIKKDEENKFATSIEVKKSITAPKKSGDAVGKIIITKNGVVVKEIPLIIKQNLKAVSFGGAFNKVVNAW